MSKRFVDSANRKKATTLEDYKRAVLGFEEDGLEEHIDVDGREDMYQGAAQFQGSETVSGRRNRSWNCEGVTADFDTSKRRSYLRCNDLKYSDHDRG